MKRTLLFMTCMLASLTMSAQGSDTDISDYIPFVEPYKGWFVICSDSVSGYYLDRYELTNEEVVKEGKTYLRMNHGKASVHEFNFAGLLREEDRKVYFYDSDLQKEFLMFDYSLKAGDTYETYSYDEQKMVTYKVLSVGDYTEGPEIKTYYFDEASGRIDVLKRYRYLRKWTICRTDDDSCQKTWIEGVGSPEGPLPNLYDSYTISSRSYLAWVKCLVGENLYLPFSYHDEFCQVHGCDLPTRAAERTEESDHQFTYEMEGDRLHVYGKAVFPGPCNYAIFIEEPTDNPLVRKLHFVTLLILPTTLDIRFFYETDFYLSGFNPNINYIVVDKWGEEHPVINKAPEPAQDNYRPLIEDGKVWTYHYYNDMTGRSFDEARVIDGDTIIGGLEYKIVRDNVGGNYRYALREEGKQVYIVYNQQQTPKLLYDFSKDKGDTITLKVDEKSGDVYEMRVVDVDTIDIDGAKFRRMRVMEYNYNKQYPIADREDEKAPWTATYWIEGVGSEFLLETNYMAVGNNYYLKSCQINGRTYKAKELLKDPNEPQIAYRPFVEEGKVWKVGYESGNPVPIVEYYYFDGDTIINGKACKKMMCQRYASPNHPDYNYYLQNPSSRYMGAWYEEDQKVYFYFHFETPFWLYDFSLDANASIPSEMTGSPSVLGPRQIGGLKGFKGVHRDVIRVSRDGESTYLTTWLEGVGNIAGPLHSFSSPEQGLFLMSCTVGDEVIYFNDEYEDGATPDVLEARKRIDFTHTIKIRPKSRTKREAEPSLYGEYNNLQLGINLNSLGDAYLVRITDESGKTVYEKTVNAGNIVGLNIDISAYAEGRYTVTVENNDESFTGEIDTRTTGISDAERLNDNGEMINDNIYNLQGQRISSLRKGLNIVSGRKVFVK